MPGRLIMDQQGAVASPDLKKDRSQAQEGTIYAQAASVQANPVPHANGSVHYGPNGVLPNGLPEPNGLPPVTNGEASSTAVALAGADHPPQLDQTWRTSHQNKSLGVLMERAAVQCHSDLIQVLTAMHEIPAEAQQQQANGVVPHTGQDTSEGSLERKRMLMEFASSQRDRFIKTFVLSLWCHNAEPKERLLDVKVWQDKQNFAHENATGAIMQTKLNMVQAKMPNPNIEGAMEVLATGKASWVPDLGYIPPKRLSAKQLLKMLREMNVILATRLNLHEDLPYHFHDFSLADGRATFTVRGEFEVDLSIADEDPATPFYFIDIRLLFTPTSNLLDERLRGFMERKANYELATKGLKGCYEFLHSFVLTHKLNVLRSQASELIRGKWFDCIRVEGQRRNLTVQYWAGTPGTKSWIEVGISSGKQKRGTSRQPATPQLAVRWFRKGVEVKDEDFEFDWRDLNLERCLEVIIAKHTASILADLQNRICSLALESSSFVAKLSNPDSSTCSGSLSLSLPSLRQPLVVRIEPVTGQFSISPPSPATANAERRLNSDPSVDAARWLAGLPCAVVQERLRKEAELLSWAPVTSLVRQDNLQAIVGEVVRQPLAFKPSPAWGESWALGVTSSLAGDKWWALSLGDKRDEQNTIVGKVIDTAHVVQPTDEAGRNVTVSQAALARLEKLAVAEVAFRTLSKQLRNMEIPHDFQTMPLANGGEHAIRRDVSPSVALFVQFSVLMKGLQNKSAKPWADEVVRLTHHGIVRRTAEGGNEIGIVRHDMRLSLESGRMKELEKHLSHSKEHDIAMNSSGALALRLLTPFGKPFVKKMQETLQSIDRLSRYVEILKQRHYLCTDVTSSRLAFTYNHAPNLGAELVFSDDGSFSAELKLTPSDSNPHQRVRVALEKGLNESGPDDGADEIGFQTLTFILAATLPVLQAFERLESKNQAKRVVAVHARSSTSYAVKYKAPLPRCMFQVRERTMWEGSKKQVRWLLDDLQPAEKDEILPEKLSKAVGELWQEQSEHWEGIGNGIVATTQGVAAAIEKLDETIRRFEGSGDKSAKPSEAPQQPATETLTDESEKPPSESSAPTKKEKQPDVVVLD